MWYIINLLAIPFYGFLLKALSRGGAYKTYFMCIVALHAVLFRALSNPYSFVDTSNYALAYRAIYHMSLFDAMSHYGNWGYGYILLNWLLTRLSYNPNVLFIVCSVLCVGIILWVYSKTLEYGYLWGILFFLAYPALYLMFCGVIRQGLAVAFVLLSLYKMDDVRYAIPYALIAILMHISAIVFLLFFIWNYVASTRISFDRYVILALITAVLLRFLVAYQLPLLMEQSDMISARYNRYLISAKTNNTIPLLIMTITFIVLLLSKVPLMIEDHFDEILFNYIIFGVILSIVCYGVNGGGRTTVYAICVVPIAISLLFKYSEDNFVKYSYLLCLALITFRQILYLQHTWVMSYDYLFFWEK